MYQHVQSHFLDLYKLLNVKSPAQADTSVETYAFEKGAHYFGMRSVRVPASQGVAPGSMPVPVERGD